MKQFFFSVLDGITKPFRGSGLKQVPGVMALYSLFFKNLRPETATVDEFTMFLDPLDSLELATKGDHFERYFRGIFRQTVTEGDVVLDLGAHIGYYTVLAARLVGNNGKVFAFEASPETSAILKKNVEVNGFGGNVTVVSKGVSNVSGTAPLYLFDTYGSMGNSMYEYGSKSKVDIETVSLDDFFAAHPVPRIDVMKIDIEGAEWSALQGMQRTLAANPDIKIFTEFYPRLLASAHVSPVEYLEAFEKLGFKLYLIDDEKEVVVPTTSADVAREITVENNKLKNLLCSRKSVAFDATTI